MRTTLDIEDDVLAAAKEMARSQGRTIGEIVSVLLRKALRPSAPSATVRNGVPLLARRPGVQLLTMERVNQLRDDE